MELDFKTNDIVERKEAQIEKIVYMRNPNKTDIRGLRDQIVNKKDIEMFLTLMSILYKTRSKSTYIKNRIKESRTSEKNSIITTEEIMNSLYKNRKNKTRISEIISENGCLLDEALCKYYACKNTNYIEKKSFIDIIIRQRAEKEILKLNPYMINQFLDYQQKPLSEEEQIIREIIDYYIASQQYYGKPRIDHVIGLLGENNERYDKRLERKVLFIMSNTYQETKDRNDSFYGYLMDILDKMDYKPQKIINYLGNNYDKFKKILEKFIDYNMCIEEGRLEELEKQPSAQYAKRIYRKNP